MNLEWIYSDVDITPMGSSISPVGPISQLISSFQK